MAAAKTRPRRITVKRASPKRSPAKRATAKRAPAKRATAKRAPAKRATTKRAPAKRATAKRAPAKRATAKRAPAKRATPKRATARSVPAKRPAPRRPATRRPGAKRRTPLELTPRTPAPAIPNAIGLVTQHLDFTSHDLDGVRRFYTELLGFSKFDHDARFDYLNISIAPQVSIGFMPPMPGPPEQWRPPREPALYFIVEDVDQACAALSARGVTLDQPPTDMPWGDRAAMLRDPEGRMVWIAQHLQKGSTR